MNQDQVAQRVAQAMQGDKFDAVRIHVPIPELSPSTILASIDGVALSVTVEILAQP